MGILVIVIGLVIACNLDDPGRVQDEVRVSVDRSAYASGDTMVVTVHNGVDSLVTTYDHQSFCWMARLQRSAPQGWEAGGPCFSTAPAHEETLEPGGDRVLRVPVQTGTDAYPAVTRGGRYRWEFEYSVGKGFSFARALRVYSREFTVK